MFYKLLLLIVKEARIVLHKLHVSFFFACRDYSDKVKRETLHSNVILHMPSWKTNPFSMVM